MNLGLDKGFLYAHVRVKTIRASSHIDVDDASLLRLQEVNVERRGEMHPEIDRTKRSVAAKEIEREPKRLIHERLLSASEKVATAGPFRGNVAGSRKPARVETRQARSSEVEKPALPKDRIIALQAVAIEGIIPMRFRVRKLSFLPVALPFRHFDFPTIRFNGEVVSFRRHHLHLDWDQRHFRLRPS